MGLEDGRCSGNDWSRVSLDHRGSVSLDDRGSSDDWGRVGLDHSCGCGMAVDAAVSSWSDAHGSNQSQVSCIGRDDSHDGEDEKFGLGKLK